MRTLKELRAERDAVIVEMRKERRGLREIGGLVGLTAGGVCRVIKRDAPTLVGIEWPRGHPKQMVPNTRALEMFALREAGHVYEEIGDQFGIARERVRQILQRWRPDLCNNEIANARAATRMRKPRIKKTCRWCGEVFEVLPCQSGRLSCSNKCHIRTRGPAILQMRAVGMTWREAADTVGACHASHAQQLVHKYARDADVDVSWAFPGHHTVTPPPEYLAAE